MRFHGPQKRLDSWPNRPRNEKNPPEKIMHGAVKFIGALIVNSCFISQDKAARGRAVQLCQTQPGGCQHLYQGRD